jgi:hypothetical protein
MGLLSGPLTGPWRPIPLKPHRLDSNIIQLGWIADTIPKWSAVSHAVMPRDTGIKRGQILWLIL